MKLSLVVPVFNQENTLVQDLNRLITTLDKSNYVYEMICVNDGSTDSSLDLIKNVLNERSRSHIKLISYPNNCGKFYAIRSGMQHAKGDVIMFIDSGMEIDPIGISMLMEHMKWYQADIIVGSKRHPASQVQYSIIRRVLSFGYHYFTKLLFLVSVKDTQAGIKIFRKEVLDTILPRLVEKKFAGDLEMLVVARHCGYKNIYEAPIRLDYKLSAVTSAATLRAIWGMIQDTLAIFYRLRIVKYYNSPHNKFHQPNNLVIYSTKYEI